MDDLIPAAILKAISDRVDETTEAILMTQFFTFQRLAGTLVQQEALSPEGAQSFFAQACRFARLELMTPPLRRYADVLEREARRDWSRPLPNDLPGDRRAPQG